MNMRSALLFPLILIAGCGQDGPENGVDTTLPSEPAKISGSLSPPGDYMPSDLQVCVETPAGKAVSCKAKVENSVFSGTYEIEVPAGAYRVYATTKDVPSYKAYYTQCSSEPNCSSHMPVIVNVAEGETRTGVNPSDWGNRPTPDAASTSDYSDPESYDTDMNATDMNALDDETTSNEPAGE
jgi:hypothetical protein